MKRLYLILTLVVAMIVPSVSATIHAADLVQKNVFAYDITVNSSNPRNPVVSYKLNGLASKVEIDVYIDNVLKGTFNGTAATTVGSVNTVAINLSDGTTYPGGVVTFKVRPTTKTPATSPRVIVDNNGYNGYIKFYNPWFLTVNNCTDSPTFGRLLVSESRYYAHTTSTNTNKYISGSTKGRGAMLYPFDPQMQPIPNTANSGKYGFNAGITASSAKYTGHSTSYVTTFADLEYSKDGRLFMASCDPTKNPLYELNPNDLNAAATAVFSGTHDKTKGRIDNSSGTMRAQIGMGMSLAGTGSNLRIAMLTSEKGDSYAKTINIYDLGTAKTWAKVPTKTLTTNGSILISPDNYTCILSPDGKGVYASSYRSAPSATSGEAGYVHYDLSASDKTISQNGVEYIANASAQAFNHDGTLLARQEGMKIIKVYQVSGGKNGAVPTLTLKYTITTTTSLTSNRICDAAWDYANNLYLSSNSGEAVVAYQIPSAAECTVPAPSSMAYTMEDVVVNPEVGTPSGLQLNSYGTPWARVYLEGHYLNGYTANILMDGTAIATGLPLSVNAEGKYSITYEDHNAVVGEHVYTIELTNGENTISREVNINLVQPSVNLNPIEDFDGRSTTRLTWTTSYLVRPDFYHVIYDGSALYQNLNYPICTHNFIPAGTHNYYVVATWHDIEDEIVSNTRSVTVNVRDASKVQYGLELVYNLPFLTPEQAAADGLAEGEYFPIVPGTALASMNLAVGSYGVAGDVFRSAVYRDGKWYLSMLTDRTTPEPDKLTLTTPHVPYISNGAYTKGTDHGHIICIDANNPLGDAHKTVAQTSVLTLAPLTNQLVTMDKAEGPNYNLVVRDPGLGLDPNSLSTSNYGWYYYLTNKFGVTPISKADNSTGSTTLADVQSTLGTGWNNTGQVNRIHYIHAAGDLMGAAGGYILAATNSNTDAYIVPMQNGTVGTIEKYTAPASLATASTENVASAIINMPEAYKWSNLNDKYFIHKIRSAGTYLVNRETGAYSVISTREGEKCSGGITFMYDDGSGVQMYRAFPRSVQSNQVGNFAIDMNDPNAETFEKSFEQSIPVQSWSFDELQTTSAGNSNCAWFGAEYDAEENCVYIYEYMPGIRFAKLRFYSYVDFPAPTPEIVVDHAIDATEHRDDDITRFTADMSWTRPLRYEATEGYKNYRLGEYKVSLKDKNYNLKSLEHAAVTIHHKDGTTTDWRAAGNVTVNSDGTLYVKDTGYEQPVGDAKTMFVIEYPYDDLNEQLYTFSVRPTYHAVDSDLVRDGEVASAQDSHAYQGDMGPVVAKAFECLTQDAAEVPQAFYRVEIDFDAPESAHPVSYYSIDVKHPGDTDFAPIPEDYVMVKGQTQYICNNSGIMHAPAAKYTAAINNTFNGNVPGTYDLTREESNERGYWNESHEAEAMPCVLYYFPTNNPTGNQYRITAHYAATNSAINKNYSNATSPIVASDIVSGVQDVITEEAVDADAIYFNVQGMQIPTDNITPGIYIKVVGRTATKVVIK